MGERRVWAIVEYLHLRLGGCLISGGELTNDGPEPSWSICSLGWASSSREGMETSRPESEPLSSTWSPGLVDVFSRECIEKRTESEPSWSSFSLDWASSSREGMETSRPRSEPLSIICRPGLARSIGNELKNDGWVCVFYVLAGFEFVFGNLD